MVRINLDALPILDLRMIHNLKALDQPDLPPLVPELIATFNETTPNQLLKIRGLQTQSDWIGIKRIAHSLKSSAANLGGKRVSKVCAILEADASAQTTTELIALLEKELGKFYQALSREAGNAALAG